MENARITPCELLFCAAAASARCARRRSSPSGRVTSAPDRTADGTPCAGESRDPRHPGPAQRQIPESTILNSRPHEFCSPESRV